MRRVEAWVDCQREELGAGRLTIEERRRDRRFTVAFAHDANAAAALRDEEPAIRRHGDIGRLVDTARHDVDPQGLPKASFADRVPRQMPQGQSRPTLKNRGS